MNQLNDEQKEAYKDAIWEIRHICGRKYTKKADRTIKKALVKLGFTKEEVEEDDGSLWFY
jgi:hypothetical protein